MNCQNTKIGICSMIIFESFNKYCHLFFNFFTNFYNPKTLESISFVLPITCSKLAWSTGSIVRLKYGSDSVSFDRQPLYSPLLWQARATGKGIIVTLIQHTFSFLTTTVFVLYSRFWQRATPSVSTQPGVWPASPIRSPAV